MSAGLTGPLSQPELREEALLLSRAAASPRPAGWWYLVARAVPLRNSPAFQPLCPLVKQAPTPHHCFQISWPHLLVFFAKSPGVKGPQEDVGRSFWAEQNGHRCFPKTFQPQLAHSRGARLSLENETSERCSALRGSICSRDKKPGDHVTHVLIYTSFTKDQGRARACQQASSCALRKPDLGIPVIFI